jgi:hypothetical protein
MFTFCCRIFEQFALQTDPVTEFIKLRSAPFKEGTTLAQKLAGSAFLLEKQLPPPKTRSSKPDPDPLIFCTI